MEPLNDLVGNIKISEFEKLLLSSDWKRIPLKREILVIYKKNHGDSFFQITLPKTRNFRDYDNVVLDAIREYSKAEGVTFEEALLAVQYSNADIIRLHISDPKIHAGSISMDSAVRIYDNAKKLLTATAMDIIDLKPMHKGRPTQAVGSFINNCKFGQTEIGSYIVPVVCPLQNIDDIEGDSKQLTLFFDDEDLSNSFTRKVTTRLMDNLTEIAGFISEPDDIDRILHEKKNVSFSANFVDALNELTDIGNESLLDFHMTWAKKASTEKSKSDSVCFTSDIKPILEALSHELKKESKADITLLGRVSQLKAKPDATERKEGTISLSYIDVDDKKKTAKIILGREDYYIAMDAHKKGSIIKIEATGDPTAKNTYKAISISEL